MWTLKIGIFLCAIAITAVTVRELVKKNAHIWLPGYLVNNIKLKKRQSSRGTIHIIFAIVDHFEPLWRNPSAEQELKRMDAWMKGYPETVRGHVDADGRCPQHTWFYPFDEYRAWHLEKLAKLCSTGYGEIELHLHHDNDTPEGLRQKIQKARQIFSKHGALIHSHPPTHSPPHTTTPTQTNPPTPPLTHFPTHPSPHSPIPSLPHSPTSPLTHPPTHSLPHLLTPIPTLSSTATGLWTTPGGMADGVVSTTSCKYWRRPVAMRTSLCPRLPARRNPGRLTAFTMQ